MLTQGAMRPSLRAMFDTQYKNIPHEYKMGFKISKKLIKDDYYDMLRLFGFKNPSRYIKKDYMKQTKKELIVLLNEQDTEIAELTDINSRLNAYESKYSNSKKVIRGLLDALEAYAKSYHDMD